MVIFLPLPFTVSSLGLTHISGLQFLHQKIRKKVTVTIPKAVVKIKGINTNEAFKIMLNS